MSRLVFLAILIVAVVAVDLKCFEVPAEKKADKYEGCTSSPAKVCAIDQASVHSYKGESPITNFTQFDWKYDGYRNCRDKVHLCKEFSFADKYAKAQTFCFGNCDTELLSVCMKFVLDNWSGYCANAYVVEADGCSKDSKYQTWSYRCDKLEASVKKGGESCTEDAECNLLPCYDEYCFDWCRTSKHCWHKAELKLLAAKDNKDCKKSYEAPWNAASTVVPSLLALVAVLLAL